MTSYLVMLQTNSNQPFIFSSPRLREQIGASFEITLLSHWVTKAVQGLSSRNRTGKSKRRTDFWVSDSSGKVIVRFGETDGNPKDLAKQLIRAVTLRALTEAPGLDVTGVFIETSSGPVDPADLKRLDREFSKYSLNRRPASARFPQFPFLQRAEESALPASTPLTDEDEGNIREYAKDLGVPLLLRFLAACGRGADDAGAHRRPRRGLPGGPRAHGGRCHGDARLRSARHHRADG